MKIYQKGFDNYPKQPRRCDRYRRRSKVKKVKIQCSCCGRWVKVRPNEVVARTDNTPIYQQRSSFCTCSGVIRGSRYV
jgi:hypothetical protein